MIDYSQANDVPFIRMGIPLAMPENSKTGVKVFVKYHSQLGNGRVLIPKRKFRNLMVCSFRYGGQSAANYCINTLSKYACCDDRAKILYQLTNS